MADKYTKGDSPSTDNKQVRITRSWSEAREESFTIDDLERQMDACDRQIEMSTSRKAELQAKIDEAEKVLAE